MSFPPSVPKDFARTQVSLRGGAGLAWLNRLPTLTEEISHRWSLKVGNFFPNLSYNWVVPALREDGAPAVLKLSFPGDGEFETEAAALAAFGGRGICRLLRQDLARGAMLLERLQPGAPLTAVGDDEEAATVAADVIKNLRRPAPSDHAFPTVSDWSRGFERLRRRFDGGTGPMPEALVGEAETLFVELLASEGEPLLLHGDLHHENILSAGRAPWLAIDPKGVIGEAAYETVPCCTTRSRRWTGRIPKESSNGGSTFSRGSWGWTAAGYARGASPKRCSPLTGASKTAAGCGAKPWPSPGCWRRSGTR